MGKSITRDNHMTFHNDEKVNSPISFNNSNFYISVILARIQKAKVDRIKIRTRQIYNHERKL